MSLKKKSLPSGFVLLTAVLQLIAHKSQDAVQAQNSPAIKKLTHISNSDAQSEPFQQQDGFCPHLPGEASSVAVTWCDLHTQYTTNLTGCRVSSQCF